MMTATGLGRPPMLLALDDTDGPDGGCTTRALLDILAALPGDLAPIGLPRLVRLNPNVPWKTRGNGAVCLPLGAPEGPRTRIGEWRGHELLAFPDGRPAAPDAAVLDAAWQATRALAQPTASPAVALLPRPPSALHYWAAVRGVVEPAQARDALLAEDALAKAAGDGRGLVGCLAAAAWDGPPSSFEFLAYREPRRCGTPRAIAPGPLLPLDAEGVTFHTHDAAARRLACVPSGPDPVLCGLRGRDPDALRDAAASTLLHAAGEPVDAWLLWATNQASGDHVTPIKRLADAPAMATVTLEATVAATPERRRGGHVRVGLHDHEGAAFDAWAFEPTKGFRDAVEALCPGDAVALTGAWQEGSVHLEKLHVRRLKEAWRKAGNPRCCGRSMKSTGRDGGHRCAACGTRAGPGAARREAVARTLREGHYEVPVAARRHLHRPLAFDGIAAATPPGAA